MPPSACAWDAALLRPKRIKTRLSLRSQYLSSCSTMRLRQGEVMKTPSLTPTRLILAMVAAGAIGAAGTSFVFGSHAHAAVPGTAETATAVAATGAISAPDFSQIAQRYGAAVVNITVSGTKHVVNDSGEGPTFHRRDSPAARSQRPVLRVLQALPAPERRIPGAGRPADARSGLRLHRRRRWHDPDQCPRRGRRQGSDGQAHRSPRVRGQGPRLGPEDRRRGAQDRRQELADRAVGQRARSQGRRMGAWPSARRSASTTA